MLRLIVTNRRDTDSIREVPHLAPGARIVFFRDPEGNIIELMEGYQDEIEA